MQNVPSAREFINLFETKYFNSSFGFTTMNLCVMWHHLLAAFYDGSSLDLDTTKTVDHHLWCKLTRICRKALFPQCLLLCVSIVVATEIFAATLIYPFSVFQSWHDCVASNTQRRSLEMSF